MKKILSIALLMGLAAGSAHAGFGIPSTGSRGGDLAVKVGKKAAGKGFEASINNTLAKKNCAFKNATTVTETTCDLNTIISDLKGWRSGLESTIVNSVSVHIEASATKDRLAWDRVSHVQNELRNGLSSWRWSTHKTTGNGDKLKIWVEIDS